MRMNLRTSVRFALVLATAFATATAAEAATWRTCNGSAVKWRGTLNIHRNRCSIPDTGIVNSAYWNGMRQWDRLSTSWTARSSTAPAIAAFRTVTARTKWASSTARRSTATTA